MKFRKLLGEFLLVLCVPSIIFASGWYDSDWPYRVKLTTNPVQTVGTVTDYVAYIDLGDMPSDFFANVDAQGGDVVVTATDGVTKLDRNLVAISIASSTGEMHVTVPSVSSATGTDIYVYYGNPTGSEVDGAASVWQDYKAVWHLEEDNSATTPSYAAGIATQQAMDGGDGGWAVLYGSNPVDSNIDLAIDEDQVGDAERNHTTEEVGYWAFVETDFDITNTGNVIIGEVAIAPSVGAASTTVSLRNTYVNPVVVGVYNLDSDGDNPAVVRVTDVQSDEFSLYVQNPSGNAVVPGDVHYVVVESGVHTLPGGGLVHAGVETISGVNRSGNWTSGQMVQIAPHVGFSSIVVLGQVMSDNDPDWQAFWTSNGTQTGPPTQTAAYVGRHVGGDTDTTRAAEEVGYIVLEQGSGSTNGVDYVAARTADTAAGVGNSPPYVFDVVSGGGGGGVVSNFFKDSTINASHGGLSGGISPVAGSAVGRGVLFDGVNNTHIPFDGITYSGSNSLNELTASFWINTTQTGRSGILDFDRSEHWQVGLNFHNAGGQGGQISFDTANSANGIRDLNSGTTINDGDWHYVTTVYDNAAIADKSIYIDGVLATAVDQHTAGLGKPTTRFGFLGNGSEASSFNGATNNLPQAGMFDEVRITHNALSADEIATTYNNQNSPDTFFTIGTQEEQNQNPSKPTVLFSDHTSAQIGTSNPSDLELRSAVHFSAVYQDPDSNDEATIARIQVSTDPTFSTISHWDSGTSTIASTSVASRSTDIEYGNFGVAASSSLSMNDGTVTYYWRIQFTDKGGLEGEWSDVALFTLLDIPNAPSGLGVLKTASDDFTISWADNSVNESEFILERKDDIGTGFGPWNVVATTTADAVSYDDIGLALNTAFMYRLSAANYAGTSTLVIDTATHYSDPAAPINVYGDYQSDTEFDVLWTDQAPVILTDSVEHCIGQTDCTADTFAQIGGGLFSGTSTLLIDTTGIVADEVIRWRVRADNVAVTSNYTYSPFEYTTPAAPTAPTATYVSDNIIDITWTDNSTHEDGFRIWVSVDAGAFAELTPGVNTVGSGATSYTYTDAVAGSSYQFEVHAHVPLTAYNAELTSAATTSVVATSPAAPTDIVATHNSDSDIDVSWSDNANNENIQVVYISVDGGLFAQVGTTTANATAFNYTAGVADSSYEFIVESVVSSNPPTNPVLLSASSTESQVLYTTPATPSIAAGSIGSLGIDWIVTDSANYEIGFELDEGDGTTLVLDVPLDDITEISEGGLSPNTLVERTIRAYVENAGDKLYSVPSAVASVYTAANTPFIATTTIMDADETSVQLVWQDESNPGYTEYFATNITTSDTFGWLATTTWNNTGLSCEQGYDYEVKARNQNNLETGFATTTAYTDTCGMTVTFPVQNQTVASTTNVGGTCSNGATVTISSSELDPNPVTVVCSAGSYLTPISFSTSTIGAVTLSVSQALDPFGASDDIDIDVVVDPSAGQDSDGDNVSDALEDAGHNGGDGNGDGILDSLQPSVTSMPDTVTGGYTTLETKGALCSTVKAVGAVRESSFSTQDTEYDYPIGLIDYELACSVAGATTSVTVYYDSSYTTSDWVLRKYASSTGYTALDSVVTVTPSNGSITEYTLLNGVAAGTTVSSFTYDIQDGDALDDDAAGMVIKDPIGPGVARSTISSGSGTRWVCKDKTATNYKPRGKEDNRLCKYDNEDIVDTEEVEVETEVEPEAATVVTATDSICSPYLTKTITLNQNNDVEEVKKLQNFLNDKQGELLPVDGIYNIDDYNAVKRFQEKYRMEVLDIWGLENPTGYVYLTTRNKINSFYCSNDIQCPYFTQFNSTSENTSSNEVLKTKILMSELGFYSGPLNESWGQTMKAAMIRFQETFRPTMLDPWGLTKGTGYKYKTTNRFLNNLVGCKLPAETLDNGVEVSY